MGKQDIVTAVEKLAAPVVAAQGLELVDVEYVREKEWYLRIYINKEGGINVDDCQAVSSEVAKLLDEKDFIKDKYYLEVSSPGIDRPLKKDADYVKNYNKTIDIKMLAPYEGKRQLEAVLLKHDDTSLVVRFEDETEHVLERAKIAIVRPHIEF